MGLSSPPCANLHIPSHVSLKLYPFTNLGVDPSHSDYNEVLVAMCGGGSQHAHGDTEGDEAKDLAEKKKAW